MDRAGARVPQHPAKELRVTEYVASPKTAWFLAEAVEPLEANGAHACRRARFGTSDEVESGTDCGNHRSGIEAAELMGKHLLLRCSDPHPNDVGAALLNEACQSKELDGLIWTERRNDVPGDAELGKRGKHARSECAGDSFVRTT